MVIIDRLNSTSDKNMKFLQKTEDGIVTETAFIEEEHRYHICYASQLGCPIGCKMCYNGIFKNYYRNLTRQEIIDECSNIVEELGLTKRQKPILFSCMGIGEPLLNYNNVISAIKALNELYPNSRFALATTAINPELITKMATDLKGIERFKLTISLHASNEEEREKLIPIKVDFKTLKNEGQRFKSISNHRCEYNYVLLDGINDSEKNAIELANFISNNDNLKISCFNKVSGCKYKKSRNIESFKKILDEKNIKYKVFESLGKDIKIACGQMLTHYNNEHKKV